MTMNAAHALLARGKAGRPAVLFEDGTVTYGELATRTRRAAAALAALGLEPGERLVMMVDDRPDFLWTHLGAMWAGAVAVALTLRASVKELAFAVVDSGCRVLVLDSEFVALWEDAAATVETPPVVVTADRRVAGYPFLPDLMDRQADTLAPVPRRPTDMAFWMYTSGTTGTPKGAVHRQSTVLPAARYLASEWGLGPEDRLYCSSKLFFAFSLGHAYLGALRLGATVVLNPGWPSPEAVAATIERHRPTAVFSVPTLYRNLLRGGLAEGGAFRAVRRFVSAGERLPDGVFDAWRDATGTSILEGIGATEAAYLFVLARPGDERPGSCGRPAPATAVRLDGKDGSPLATPGTPGVLWIRSDTLADGYWQQPDRTAAAFRDGWYRTGDVFALDGEGRFFHRGRADDMLKVSGQWVSPAEIEEVVLAVPDVTDAAVVAAPDGDGLERLSLFIVIAGMAGGAGAADAVRNAIGARLRAALPLYKCPRRIHRLDTLPRTATGKVQRFLLRAMAARLMAGPRAGGRREVVKECPSGRKSPEILQ